MLHGEDFSEIDVLVAIRYQLTYQDSTNLMQQLLQEYLGNAPWIPYDYVMRQDTFNLHSRDSSLGTTLYSS